MSSSKQWVVGYFDIENKYSVIPNNWLIQCGNIYFCKWPKNGNISKMKSSFEEPENDWPTFPVKIITQSFNTYEEAAIKEKEIFISATASESDNTEQVNKQKKKRKIIEKPTIDDDSSCSSAQLTPIKILKVTNNCASTCYQSYANNADSFKTPEKLDQMTNCPAIIEPEVFTSALTSVYELSPPNFSNTILDNKMPSTVTHNVMPSTITLNEMSSTADNAILKLILEKVSTTLAYVKRIDEKMNTTASVMTQHNNIMNEFLNLFPMKDVESLQNIDKKLSLEIEFENQMINFVTKIGGNNTNNFIKRIFGRLFTNQLATKYSWTGFRNDCQLQNLNLIKIIKNIALKTFNSTEIEFENHVKNWFRHGQQRLNREKK